MKNGTGITQIIVVELLDTLHESESYRAVPSILGAAKSVRATPRYLRRNETGRDRFSV